MAFLSKLHILPAYALPLLSFCLAFINISLYFGESFKVKSPMANTLNFFQSLVIPLFVLVLFEMTFRLHEVRSAKVSPDNLKLIHSFDNICFLLVSSVLLYSFRSTS